MYCTIGERGQVTIPKKAREALGFRTGMRLEVTVEDGAVMIRRPGIEDALSVWEGSADTGYASTDDFIQALRDSQ